MCLVSARLVYHGRNEPAVGSERCVVWLVPVLFTYLVEQQPDQAAACCESLFTGLALYLPFDILSCCESLYSNRRHNLCVSRQVGARATGHLLVASDGTEHEECENSKSFRFVTPFDASQIKRKLSTASSLRMAASVQK